METVTTETSTATFLAETLEGLQANPKFMRSKYFYNAQGDLIFQQIMNSPSYYLTDAEMGIMVEQSADLSKIISAKGDAFDLIELGAGDATKSIHLLRQLVSEKLEFSYLPIDISEHVIDDLEERLPKHLPTLNIVGLNGDYFEMLDKAISVSKRKKVVLFMGANIGNMTKTEAIQFCKKLRSKLSKNDMLIVGFDLKKNPKKILEAYNDKEGITALFNLNLLSRINEELGANFNIGGFEHYATYNPENGECKSYLISLKNQQVSIAAHQINFTKNEYIFMEISQKYSLANIEKLALETGFKPIINLTDNNHLFVDAIWTVE